MKRALMIAALAALIVSCASKGPLTSVPIERVRSVKHEFTLIYFVGTAPDDIRRAVILDLNNDDYEFLPDVQDFEYEILQNVDINEAMYETKVFLQHEKAIKSFASKAVLDSGGRPIGYELRPLYNPEIHGNEDILEVSYELLRKNKVKISISLRK